MWFDYSAGWNGHNENHHSIKLELLDASLRIKSLKLIILMFYIQDNNISQMWLYFLYKWLTSNKTKRKSLLIKFIEDSPIFLIIIKWLDVYGCEIHSFQIPAEI